MSKHINNAADKIFEVSKRYGAKTASISAMVAEGVITPVLDDQGQVLCQGGARMKISKIRKQFRTTADIMDALREAGVYPDPKRAMERRIQHRMRKDPRAIKIDETSKNRVYICTPDLAEEIIETEKRKAGVIIL